MTKGTVYWTKRQITTSQTRFKRGEQVVYIDDRSSPGTDLHVFAGSGGRSLSIPAKQLDEYLQEVQHG